MQYCRTLLLSVKPSIRDDLTPSSGPFLYCTSRSSSSTWIITVFSSTTSHFLHYLNDFLSFFFFFFFKDTSRSIPTTRTDTNPQTKGLRLPERNQRHNGKLAQQDEPIDGQRGADTGQPCSAQKQPSSHQPQAVTPSPLHSLHEAPKFN